jgi:hypothetical protein
MASGSRTEPSFKMFTTHRIPRSRFRKLAVKRQTRRRYWWAWGGRILSQAHCRSSSAFMSSIHSAHNGLTELQGHNQILTEKAYGNCADMPSIQEFSRWSIGSNVNNLPSIVQGRDSSVGIVTGYELHNRGIEGSFPHGVTVLFSTATRPVTGALSPVVTAVTIKDVVLWDVAPCEFCNNLRFGRTCRFHLQGRKIRYRGKCDTFLRNVDCYKTHTALRPRRRKLSVWL